MTALFTLDHVDYAPGGKAILRDLTLTVPEHAAITIVGPSGAGKSTLLRLLATLLTPSHGTILYRGQPQTTWPHPQYRQQVSYCFQQPTLFGETVQDNLSFPFAIRGQAFDAVKAEAALAAVDLPESMLKTAITELSGGEKQRVALIRNLLFPPQVLLLDEVTTGLDAVTKATVRRLIDQWHADGVALLSVTHDETEIAAATTRWTLRAGRLEGQDD
ncbi:ABC transporter ATP-binding protein [Lacticaseibacillus absianus]|uniref:ABC transporter ATP-binding protein n=1 Tax=Lacticaseibacillus absianus TaxID=2729623 RepID=UPI0015CA55A1|nr:ATP-binding cassette domain-containing protein [Lacticaseibacillus absianus]